MDDDVKLYCGDCLELMKNIPDKSVDMVLCDMPYGTTRNKWDSVLPLDKIWKEYRRITKANSPIVLFSQQPFSATLINSNKKEFKYEWIWQKDNATGFLNAHKMPLRIHENILVFYRNTPTYNPQMRTGFKPYIIRHNHTSSNYGAQTACVQTSEGDRFPIDIISFTRDKDKFHPTQKPVKLLEYLINTYTVKGGLVLDNCMGSGSTAVACVNTGRKFIGMELDETYFEIAKERVQKARCAGCQHTLKA